MEKRLFVGNLPYSVGESELESAFGEYGTVVSAVVIRDRESGRSRGFGFIEMETAAQEGRSSAALGFW
jgi:RNA recognition motif-containing protein